MDGLSAFCNHLDHDKETNFCSESQVDFSVIFILHI